MSKHVALGGVSRGLVLVLVLVLVLAPGLGCYQTSVPSCTVSCATDSDCPGDLHCSVGGKCSTGEACGMPCTPNEFQRCSATTIERCNSSGDGLVSETCGAGCNANRGACNACVPDELSCSSETLQKCMNDGPASLVVATCQYGCVAAAGAAVARCAHLAPAWAPNACDVPATSDLTLSGPISIDTDNVNCTSIEMQATGQPQLCVLHYRAITFQPGSVVTIIGSRILVFIADDALRIEGVLDVGANFTNNGPGVVPGTSSGTPVNGPHGGGGAGFGGDGASGGDGDGVPLTGGGAGGARFQFPDPPDVVPLRGGARGGTIMPDVAGSPSRGGGGGGAVVLGSCSGTVTVNGVIDASGGGGEPGFDTVFGTGTSFVGGAGGGAGGYVVLQGRIELTSLAEIYANGGAGGGGSSAEDMAGIQGEDGRRSMGPCAQGGNPNFGGFPAGRGGNGACVELVSAVLVNVNPQPGNPGDGGGSAGGGGGAFGRLQVFAPVGHPPLADFSAKVSLEIASPAVALVR